MKIILKISFLVSLIACSKSVSQNMEYYPEKRQEISQQDFNHGTRILQETYERINNRAGQKDFSDYWNFAVAYTYLGEQNEEIKKMIAKSYQLDSELFSAASKIKPEMIKKWEAIFSEEEYKKIFKNIESIKSDNQNTIAKRTVKNVIEMDTNRYDTELVRLMQQIRTDDQKYRVGKNRDADRQAVLDKKNLTIIDSLFEIHQQYIGSSLVGKKYESVMWAVIQHSNLEVMEKYLPIIHSAVKKNELAEGPLKLLIDRVYAIKHGYQIFDTQYAEPKIPTAPEQIVENVLKEYDLTKRKRHETEINMPSKENKNNPVRSKDTVVRWGENKKLEN